MAVGAAVGRTPSVDGLQRRGRGWRCSVRSALGLQAAAGFRLRAPWPVSRFLKRVSPPCWLCVCREPPEHSRSCVLCNVWDILTLSKQAFAVHLKFRFARCEFMVKSGAQCGGPAEASPPQGSVSLLGMASPCLTATLPSR